MPALLLGTCPINNSRAVQNNRHFTVDIFKCMFLKEKFYFLYRLYSMFLLQVHLTMGQYWSSASGNGLVPKRRQAITWVNDEPVTDAFMHQQASMHYGDVIISTMASQITSLTIAYSIVYPGADKKNKALRHWPLWGEFTGDRWIPRTKGQWRGKSFHLMTSSWS